MEGTTIQPKLDGGRVRYWRVGALLWAANIFWASTSALASENTRGRLARFLEAWLGIQLTPASLSLINVTIRKTVHIFEYTVLAILLFGSLGGFETPRHRTRHLVWAFGLTFAYACSDEFHQLFVAGRGASPRDLMFDLAGAALGAALARYATFFTPSCRA